MVLYYSHVMEAVSHWVLATWCRYRLALVSCNHWRCSWEQVTRQKQSTWNKDSSSLHQSHVHV
eukprot:scaffold321476_cov18-Tisochrysis_lutea.AAC.1